ncbi:hypothetical protein [Streptomyces hawaiiensis]|uniref:hypothetical protein n=1 Tax=Streptomyces hawaiiensis TaxID=67305 RepID=UPI003659BAF3
MFLAYRAASYLDLKEPEPAAAAATRSLLLARRIGAPRCIRLVDDLLPRFQPYARAQGQALRNSSNSPPHSRHQPTAHRPGANQEVACDVQGALAADAQELWITSATPGHAARRPSGRHHRRVNPLDKIEYAHLLKDQGTSYGEISTKTDIPHTSLHRHLQG